MCIITSDVIYFFPVNLISFTFHIYFFLFFSKFKRFVEFSLIYWLLNGLILFFNLLDVLICKN